MWRNKPVKNTKLIIIIIMITLTTLNTQTYHTYSSISIEESELIETAEEKIIETFIVLSQAEKAGAEVSSMLNKLSLLIDDINEAKKGLNEDQTDIYINKLQTYIDSVNDISTEALTLKNTAIALQEEIIRNRLFFSVLRTTVFILLMLGAWYIYKSYQTKNLLKYKPEVV